jgi:hypothetical protein
MPVLTEKQKTDLLYCPIIWNTLTNMELGTHVIKPQDFLKIVTAECKLAKLSPISLAKISKIISRGYHRWITKRNNVYTFHLTESSIKTLTEHLLTPEQIEQVPAKFKK